MTATTHNFNPLTFRTGIPYTVEGLLEASKRLAAMTPAELLNEAVYVQVSEQDDPGPDFTPRPWR